MAKYLRCSASHLFIPAALLVTLLLTPLAAAEQEAGGEPPLIAVSTVGMLGDPVAIIGGRCVTGTWLMGSGVDPHLYRASARDVAELQQAQVIFYAGNSLEGQLGEVLDGFARRTPTVAVAERMTEDGDLITTGDGYGVDPHLWMDLRLWAKGVPVIANVLTELRPACSEHIRENSDRYLSQLQALDGWVEEAVAGIPQEQRILVTAHDAFAYYGRRYGIEVAGIQGVSTESEAGIADIRATAQLVARRQVPTIFVESTISPRTIEAVVAAAEQQGHEVTVGAPLYSDAMGEAGSVGGTYMGMLFENTVNIVAGLGGEIPPLPDSLLEWADAWDIDPESPGSR